MINKYVILVLLLCGASNLYAIDKDFHPVVTELAINDYNRCVANINRKGFDPKESEQIAIYSRVEDESPVWDRMSNWHFHDEFYGKEHALKKRGFFNTSLHKLFDKRVKQFMTWSPDVYSAPENGFYEAESQYQLSGRIVHFIQDMAVPAHVSGIYHSKPDGWLQRLFVDNEPDQFDELFTRENIKMLGNVEIDEDTCKTLFEQSQSTSINLLDVLNEFAATTRNNVRKQINVPGSHLWHGKTWQDIFWPIRTDEDKDKPFLHPKYGENGFLEYQNNFDINSSLCAANDSNVCWDFFKEQYRQVRNNTVLALMIMYLR